MIQVFRVAHKKLNELNVLTVVVHKMVSQKKKKNKSEHTKRIMLPYMNSTFTMMVLYFIHLMNIIFDITTLLHIYAAHFMKLYL